MICNVCKGTGFKNLWQIPDEELGSDDLIVSVPKWIASQATPHDVCACDCCGNGDIDGWYGIPGQHYSPDDPPGKKGCYAYNGGLCKCH